MHIIPAAVMTSEEPQSSTDTSAVTMQAIDNQGQLYQQQPTYVLLQTTGEQDGSGQPQVFLAMQTGGVTGQDSQVILSNLAFELFLCSVQFKSGDLVGYIQSTLLPQQLLGRTVALAIEPASSSSSSSSSSL